MECKNCGLIMKSFFDGDDIEVFTCLNCNADALRVVHTNGVLWDMSNVIVKDDRNTAINNDDILNLKIALNTSESFDNFLQSV